jgi:hypothetical protein
MSSIPAVANLAATYIGTEARISSLDDDRTVARKLKGVWDISRQAAIRDGAWNFASRRAALAAATVSDPATIHPWANRFPLPPESLRLIQVFDLHHSRWQAEDDAVLCDSAGPVRVRYAIDIDEPAKWDSLFVEAFARKLAIAAGPSIAGSNFSVEVATRWYDRAIAAAKRVDARENPSIEQADSSWIEARATGHYAGTVPGVAGAWG